MTKHEECNYLRDKPDRDRVREKIHNKVLTVDDVIKKVYENLEAFQKEFKEKDCLQDKHIEELKAMIQEIAATQSSTDEELQQLKLQMETVRKDIADLREHLDNGYTEKLSNNITDRLFALIEMMNQNNHTIKRTEIETENDIKIEESLRKKMLLEKWFDLLTRLLTAGGIIYLLLDKAF